MENFGRKTRRLSIGTITLLAAWIIVGAITIHLNTANARPEEKKTCEPTETEKKLFDAIANGDLKKVEAALAAGAAPDGRFVPDGDQINACPSPLIHALRLGRNEILRVLLNASHTKAKSATATTILSADGDLIEKLADPGADVDKPDYSGNAPLTTAANYGREEIASFLIERGAKVNLRNKNGATALMVAVSRYLYPDNDAGKDKIVELLIAGGADVNIQDDDGNTALILAAKFGRLNAARILLENRADTTLRNRSGETALMSTAVRIYFPLLNDNKPEIIKLLARYKADINAKDREGNTLLISAVRSPRTGANQRVDPIIIALLSSGINVNARNNNGCSALIELVKYGDSEYIESPHDQFTVDTIKLLIAGGADVNAENNDGDTALKIAVMRSNSDSLGILNALITGKADLEFAGSSGEPALLLSIRRAAGRNDSEIVRTLTKAGAKVNIRDHAGTPILVFAVRESGNAEVVRLLLEAGARVNDKDLNGETALISAVREYLPSSNEAAKNAFRRDPEVIRILLAAGADVTLKDKGGFTAFNIAKRTGNQDIVRLLGKSKK